MSALIFWNLYTEARTLAQRIEDARDQADAREDDWTELTEARAELERAAENGDTAPAELIEDLNRDIRAARAAWELADEKLQALVCERAALSLRLDAVKVKRAPEEERRLTGYEYDRIQEREDREAARAAAMQRVPVSPWWLTVEV